MITRIISALLIVLLSSPLLAQQSLKPQKLLIINDSIVTMEVVDGYLKDGKIKGMQSGVSDEERARLAKIHGDKIADNFIMVISLKTAEEMAAPAPKPAVAEVSQEDPIPGSYKLNINDVSADFTVEMLDGNKIKLSELKGQVVLLNFWATWCAPCMMEFYEMPDQILKKFEKEKLVFLPVSRGETRAVVEKKMEQLKEKGIRFQVGLDPDKKIWNQYATSYIPKNFLIDKKGVIRYVSTGYTEESLGKLAKEIEKLLRE